jgi:hypothetical protein
VIFRNGTIVPMTGQSGHRTEQRNISCCQLIPNLADGDSRGGFPNR